MNLWLPDAPHIVIGQKTWYPGEITKTGLLTPSQIREVVTQSLSFDGGNLSFYHYQYVFHTKILTRGKTFRSVVHT